MISTWRIATETAVYKADDISGSGAKETGGRWNRKGTALIYTSTTQALACLETVVHFNAQTLPLNRYLVRFDIPDNIWKKREALSEGVIEVGWDALPAGSTSLDIGDAWVRENRTCIMEVPSVIIPEEFNVLINPAHPDIRYIKATKIRKWLYDTRFRS
jgi:RES domain-containing protein